MGPAWDCKGKLNQPAFCLVCSVTSGMQVYNCVDSSPSAAEPIYSMYTLPRLYLLTCPDFEFGSRDNQVRFIYIQKTVMLFKEEDVTKVFLQK